MTPANNNVKGAARALGDISSLMEIMNHNTRVMLRRLQRDYKASLQSAKDDNIESRIMFYEMALCNLFKELQFMDE